MLKAIPQWKNEEAGEGQEQEGGGRRQREEERKNKPRKKEKQELGRTPSKISFENIRNTEQSDYYFSNTS